MATVELKNVSKHYGEAVAVAGLSLVIQHGEFVALLGPSGCGKTTTLQMLAGFIEPTGGDIFVEGRSMRGVAPHKRNIGVVFQSYALFPHLTVFDNVAFGLRMRSVSATDTAARVARALDLVQLTSLEQRYPKALSGGQQQRVALARALVIEPSVLLLDEPLSNLDANLREQMRFEIREIQKRIGITTVFVTHDQNEAMAAADRLVVMSKGEIRQVGTGQEIYEAPADLFVAQFIGKANLLRGVIVRLEGDMAELDAGTGMMLRAPHRGRVRTGDRAALALRPEDLRLAESPVPNANNVSGTVGRINYLGAALHVTVRVGDTVLAMALPRGSYRVAEGADAVVTWSPSAGVLLPEGA
jgi:spermidine/putrescine ABC transporter ATP-binding subunit